MVNLHWEEITKPGKVTWSLLRCVQVEVRWTSDTRAPEVIPKVSEMLYQTPSESLFNTVCSDTTCFLGKLK